MTGSSGTAAPAAGVSVVIPAHQAAAFLADALGSVWAQTVLPGEVVVVDDGSTDGTAAVATGWARSHTGGPPLRLVRQDNEGAGAARNRGAGEARGELLAFLDADDLWAPAKLERQLAALAEHPGAGAVFALARNVAAFGVDPATVPAARPASGCASALLVRRAVLDAVGPFGTGPLQDWIGWYARLQDLGVPVVTVPEVLVTRRIHGANSSIVLRHERGAYLRELKAIADRRRSGTDGTPD